MKTKLMLSGWTKYALKENVTNGKIFVFLTCINILKIRKERVISTIRRSQNIKNNNIRSSLLSDK